MTERRSHQAQAIWLKAIAPGAVMSCVLFAAWIYGWRYAFSLQSFVLLTTAWLAGIAWATMREPGRALDTDQSAADGAELQVIARSVTIQLAEEIAGVCTEVQRSRSIVQEAVVGLNLSFHKLSVHAQRRQSGMNVATQQGAAAASACQASSLPGGSERFNDDIAQAVRCLQFEDIVSQSLSTADDHLLRLTELETLMQRVLEPATSRDPVRLKQLKADVEDFVAARSDAGRKVLQDSMADGDIELF